MENRSNLPARRSLLAAAFAALMLALCALACPATAHADETDVIAHSIDQATQKRTDYTSVNDAINAGYNGATIIMDADWVFGDRGLTISSDKTCTIDLNGHRITSSAYATISVRENASLKLTSSANPTDFKYRGYTKTSGGLTDQKWGWQDLTVNTCGLVTNTRTGNLGRGIVVSGGKLQVENITIAGCWANGITASNCTIDLKNTTVCHNAAGTNPSSSNGAGICMDSTGVTLNMDASHVDDNCAQNNGGGVFVSGDSTINLENGSTVSRNAAGDGGGGFYCGSYGFTIKSEDKTGTIEDNASLNESGAGFNKDKSGGGIHVDSVVGDNSGLIEGVTIKGNYSGYDGGGVELDQENTRLVNCKIIGNSARCDGGGVFVYNDGSSIEGCEIRGNWCGGSYEGGGVFVSYHYDLKLSGTCVIKGNTRGEGSGNADDVFLSTLSGGGGKAYITGSLSEGSTVGVRTGITGDRRIAKSFKHDSDDCLFIDQSGYYVSYGSEEGGDAWQRHRELAFAAKLDGDIKARYKQGATATLVAPKFKGSQVFWRWDDYRTSGLNPIGDYLSGDALASNVFSFSMPQNDVNARTQYVPFAEKVEVEIDSPEAGQALPATAKVRRDDDLWYGNAWATASVTWYEVDGDTRTQVSGTAKAGTVYAVTICCASDPSIPLYFNSSICWSSVTIPGVAGLPIPDSASVDPKTGTLTVNAKFAKTEGEKTEVKGDKVSVKMENGGLMASAEASAAAADEPMLLSASDGSLGGFEVSYAKDSESVTVAAPAKAGYNFNHWSGVPAGVEYDDTDGYVTIPVSALADDPQLTAVYTPAVTGVEVVMDEPAPSAGGKLATTVESLVLTGSDGSTLDLVEEIGKGPRTVTWSPEPEDGTADFSTAYTALVELADGEGLEDVEKVLADGAAVRVSCGGEAVEAEAAGFTVKDGKLCLAVSFPATRDVKAVSVSQPADVELTFEQAKACSELNTWPLSRTVDVKLENDEAAEGDITWQAVEGFDASATAAQELTVKGAVSNISNADGDEIDDSGVSHEVACTVKVAAPSQDGGSGADGNGNADGSGNVDKGGKSALAKTGDTIPVFAVAGVAAVALIAAGAASIAALRRRRS